MGKDRSGKFHPPKGHPSDASGEGLGLRPDFNNYDDAVDKAITEKYTTGPDKLAEQVPLLHPNRNLHKKDNVKSSGDDERAEKSIEQKTGDDSTDGEVQAEELPRIYKEILRELAACQNDICVTIFLATHDQGMEVNEQVDHIQFKNALQRATGEWLQQDTNDERIRSI